MPDTDINKKLESAGREKSKRVVSLLCDMLSNYGFYYTDIMAKLFDVDEQDELATYYREMYTKQSSEKSEEDFVNHIMEKIAEMQKTKNEKIRSDLEFLFYKENKSIASEIDKNGGISKEKKQFQQEIERRKNIQHQAVFNDTSNFSFPSLSHLYLNRSSSKMEREDLIDTCRGTVEDLLDEGVSKKTIADQLAENYDLSLPDAYSVLNDCLDDYQDDLDEDI